MLNKMIGYIKINIKKSRRNNVIGLIAQFFHYIFQLDKDNDYRTKMLHRLNQI